MVTIQLVLEQCFFCEKYIHSDYTWLVIVVSRKIEVSFKVFLNDYVKIALIQVWRSEENVSFSFYLHSCRVKKANGKGNLGCYFHKCFPVPTLYINCSLNYYV